MKKKQFESFLSQIETFQNFKIQLEQYSTSVELAGKHPILKRELAPTFSEQL